MRTAITKAPRRPAALAGRRGASQSGSGVRQHKHPPFKGDVPNPGAAAGVGPSVTMQPNASLLLCPGPRQGASESRDGETRRRRPVEEARDDSW